jgi:hypothetical protein
MAKSDNNVDYKRKFREAERKIAKLERSLGTHRRAVTLGNDLWYSMIDPKNTLATAKSNLNVDWAAFQTQAEADLVSLQTELDGLTGDKAAAEALIDGLEADILAQETALEEDTATIEAQRVLLAAAITAWLGSEARRGSTPR